MKNIITIREMVQRFGWSIAGTDIILYIMDNFTTIKEECFFRSLKGWGFDFDFPFDTIKLYKYFTKAHCMSEGYEVVNIAHNICNRLRDNYVIDPKEKIEERINKIEIELEELKKGLIK